MQLSMDWISYAVLVCVSVAQFIGQVSGARNILPHFDTTLKRNVTCMAGKIAILNCKVLDRGTTTVTWRKKGVLHPLTIAEDTFTGDQRFRVDHDRRTAEWKLVIDKVVHEDTGTYICVVNTIKSKLEWTVRLTVKKMPKRPAVQVSGTKTVSRGKMIQLYCNATGEPDDVTWYKDGNPVRGGVDTGIFITKTVEKGGLFKSVLVIRESSMDDKGSYVCSTTNDDSERLYVDVLNVDQENYKRGRSDAITSNGSVRSCEDTHIRQLTLILTLLSLTLTLNKMMTNCL